MKAVYSPGPAYGSSVGWHVILDQMRLALEEGGYEVISPLSPSSSGEPLLPPTKYLDYDLRATEGIADDLSSCNVFLGASTYSLIQLSHVRRGLRVVFLFSCSELYRALKLPRALRDAGARYDYSEDVTGEWINCAVLSRADLLVVPSQFVCQTYAPYGVPESRFAVIPWGFDHLPGRGPEREPDSQGRLRVLYIGSDHPRKGLLYLLGAFSGLSEKEYVLTLVGPTLAWQGARMPAFLPFTRLPHVRSAGMVPKERLPELFAAHDVFVLPSLEEGVSLACMEAMAYGLPCVVTPEQIEYTGEGGIEVPYYDPGAIRDRLVELRGDPGLRLRVGAAARAKARSRTWSDFRRELGGAILQAAREKGGNEYSRRDAS